MVGHRRRRRVRARRGGRRNRGRRRGAAPRPPRGLVLLPARGLVGADAAAGSRARPILAAQVTELADGVFVTMSLNHGVADGAAFWHLFNHILYLQCVVQSSIITNMINSIP
jgi:hypothetical protein